MKKSTSDEGSRGPCADVAVDTRHRTAENGVPYARGPRIGRRVGPWLALGSSRALGAGRESAPRYIWFDLAV